MNRAKSNIFLLIPFILFSSISSLGQYILTTETVNTVDNCEQYVHQVK